MVLPAELLRSYVPGLLASPFLAGSMPLDAPGAERFSAAVLFGGPFARAIGRAVVPMLELQDAERLLDRDLGSGVGRAHRCARLPDAWQDDASRDRLHGPRRGGGDARAGIGHSGSAVLCLRGD